MAKKVFYDEDARRRVLGGAKLLYEAVKTTMGPKGRNVVLSKSYGAPTVTHDGVTVAKGVEIADVDDETLGYKVGAELIKEAASKMNDAAGDGTTTVTVLTYHILNEANKLIAAGHNPMQLRKGLEQAASDVIAQLEKMSEAITGKSERVAEVATISAGDNEIGKLIADVMEKVGKDGVVTVEEGQGLSLESEVVEGFTFDRGFVSPYMVTDAARMEAAFTKPAIVITDKKISSIQEISGLMEQLVQAGKKDMVLIAEDVEGDALTMLVLNKLKGVFNTVAVKAPSFGDRRKEILQDIATLTGATVISEEQGYSFETVDISVVGSARKVIVNKDGTTIIEGVGKSTDIKGRMANIDAQIKATTSKYDRGELSKRKAALGGKVAVIKVGGASETEIEEKKYRVDDAVAAVKAAMTEGVVPGGGVTLVNLSKSIKIPSINVTKERSGITTTIPGFAFDSDVEYTAGYHILKIALVQPFVQIMENAGVNAQEKLAQVLNSDRNGYGYNVNDPFTLVEMSKQGIVDPVLVTKQAVQNAVSIAGTSMTMGALVVDVPEPKAPVGAGPMGLDM